MSNLTDIGNLMYLYLDNIDPGKGTDTPQFLINAAADILHKNGEHNWVPVIVKETEEDYYKVIGNSFIYAVAQAAGLERVWCIIADSSQEAQEITQVLAREVTPKINLSHASRDDIKSALEYLIEQPGSPLKGVNLLVATNKIDESDRKYWQTLDPITKLKCGITKGKKLEAIKQIFTLTPEPMTEKMNLLENLAKLTVKDLKSMAKERDLVGYNKLKKAELIQLLRESF